MRDLNLCVVYMCDIEMYVPHTCTTWILCHTHTYIKIDIKHLNIIRYLNLCVVYMCDIDVYVPHTCATWILCHT